MRETKLAFLLALPFIVSVSSETYTKSDLYFDFSKDCKNGECCLENVTGIYYKNGPKMKLREAKTICYRLPGKASK